MGYMGAVLSICFWKSSPVRWIPALCDMNYLAISETLISKAPFSENIQVIKEPGRGFDGLLKDA